MISHPEKSDIPYLKNMWHEIFGDNEDYIDLFFTDKFSIESSLVYKVDKKPVSMIFFPQYEMKAYSDYIKTGYICGAATLPDYRNNGIMSEMLKESFNKMKDRNDILSILIPASETLYNYYERFRYYSVFYRKRVIQKREGMSGNLIKLSQVKNSQKITDIYLKKILSFKIAVMQSAKTYDTVINDYLKASGETLIIGKDDGFCFAIRNEDKLYVREIFTLNSNIKDVYYSLFKRYRDINTIISDLPADFEYFDNSSVIKTGMIKILDRESAPFLNVVNKESDDINFTLKYFMDDGVYPYMNMMLD